MAETPWARSAAIGSAGAAGAAGTGVGVDTGAGVGVGGLVGTGVGAFVGCGAAVGADSVGWVTAGADPGGDEDVEPPSQPTANNRPRAVSAPRTANFNGARLPLARLRFLVLRGGPPGAQGRS